MRLPTIVLPTFTGKPEQSIELFVEQFEALLTSSAISPKHWVTYQKQQTQKDTILHVEKEHAVVLNATPLTDAQHKEFFRKVKATLLSKRCKPRTEQVRDLLENYYKMNKLRSETVAVFAHCFLDCQHKLTKLIQEFT